MREMVRELRELAAAGPEALVGHAICPEEWFCFSTVEMAEELGAVLPSASISGARYPIEKVEVTGRTVRHEYHGGARVRVKVTFKAVEGMVGGAACGWMLV